MQSLLRWALTFVGYWPLPLLHALGWLAGTVLWLVPNGLREVTLTNIQLCLPGRSARDRRRISRVSLIESMKAVTESPAIWFGPAWRLRSWLGDEKARLAFHATATSPSRGTIWLTPHLGSWELAGQFVAQFGPLTLLYKPQKGALDALVRHGRSRNRNAKPAPTTPSGVKALLAALDRGEMIGILPDHDPPEGSGRFAPFFGVPAHSMDLVGKLAARSGASVWFILAERLSWGRGFRFHITPAPEGIGDPSTATEALNKGVEECVRRLPQQYWWSYQRFRRRPHGVASLYR